MAYRRSRSRSRSRYARRRGSAGRRRVRAIRAGKIGFRL